MRKNLSPHAFGLAMVYFCDRIKADSFWRRFWEASMRKRRRRVRRRGRESWPIQTGQWCSIACWWSCRDLVNLDVGRRRGRGRGHGAHSEGAAAKGQPTPTAAATTCLCKVML